jgi:hypothetical protein
MTRAGADGDAGADEARVAEELVRLLDKRASSELQARGDSNGIVGEGQRKE